jgi:hypothetical protein
MLFRLGHSGLGAAILALLCAAGPQVGHGEPALSANEVVSRAVARAQQTGVKTPRPDCTYVKMTVTDEFDATGHVRQHKERTYQVSSKAGATSVKLVEVNGHPPDSAELKLQAENETNLGRVLGQSHPTNGDESASFLTPELAARFSFTLLGQKEINGRPAYQVAFVPVSPEAPIHHMIDRILNRVSGTLWIDAQEFELARADIQLRSEVELLAGILGVLRKFDLTITRARMPDGFWLNSLSNGDFEGRKLLDSKRIKTKSQISNFKPVA